MKKNLLVLLLSILTGTIAQAQFVKNDWGRFFGETAYSPTALVQLQDIESDASGNVYAVGAFRNTVDFDPGPGVVSLTSGQFNIDNAWFAKYSSSGALLWVKTLSGIPNVYSKAHQLTIDADGNIYISGACNGALDLDPSAGTLILPDGGKWFMAKYDANGNIVWGTGYFVNFAITHLFINSNNELVSLGSLWSNISSFYLSAFNKSTGEVINSYSIKSPVGSSVPLRPFDALTGTDFFKATQDINSNYVLCGAYCGEIDFDLTTSDYSITSVNALTDRADMFVCKYNSAMDLQWAFSLGGVNGQGIYSSNIVTDVSGNIYVGGVLKDTIDFDPGPGTTLLYPDFTVNGRGFIAKYSSSGNFVWAKLISNTSGLGDVERSAITDIKLSADGNSIYFMGTSASSGDFNTSQSVDLIMPAGVKGSGIYAQASVIGNIDLNGDILNVNRISSFGYSFPDDSFWIDLNNNLYIGLGSVIRDENYPVTFSFGACENDPSILQANFASNGATISKFSPCNNPPVITTQPQDALGCDGSPLTINVGVSGASCKKYHWMKLIDQFNYHTWQWQSDSTALYFPKFSASDTGTYICTVEGECGSISTRQFVISGPITAVNLYVQQPHTVTVCEGTSYTFNFSNFTTATGTSPIYQWKKGNTVLSDSSSTVLSNISTVDSGTYYGIASNYCGADTLEIYFIVNQTTSSSLNQTACTNYTLNGQTYTTSNTYTQTLINAAGCDSIITLNLNITQPRTSLLLASVCSDYTLNGDTYTKSGVYTQVLTSSAGCDSIITLNLTINPPTNSSLMASACSNYMLNGQTYTKSGVYTQTLSNKAGCDSIVTLNLTINTIDPTVVLTGNTITANSTNSSYKWLNCNTGSPVAGATSRSFTPIASGNYAVVVTENGCSVTSTCTNIITTGNSELKRESGFIVYPNPSNGIFRLTIDNPLFDKGSIEIYNVIGEKVYTTDLKQQTTNEIDLSKSPKGIYLVRVYEGANVYTRKIVVQ